MRTVELTDRVDLQALTSKPGIYVARADTPAYGDLLGFVVAGEVAELGQAMSPDGVHMLAVQTGAKANPAITIGAEFFAGAKADYSYWQEKWWREAIQNAVDAGATNIVCTVETINDRVVVTCSDNGSGMDEETLINKFLVLGRSGKGGAPGSVGGFGKAKELLLLPWISWAVQTKKDGHPGVVVEGHGIQYDVKPIEDTRGTTITVEMAPDDCTTQFNAISFIKKCYLPNVKFTVNGEKVTANLKVGELVRTIENDANVYFDRKAKMQPVMLVRVNGMYMHEVWISSDIKGVVVVELLGPSTQILTSNRDGIGKRELRYALNDFQNELAANTKTALRKKKNVVRERFHGEGKFRIKPELVQRDILVAVGDLTPAGAHGQLSADQQADVQRVVEQVGAVANEEEGAQIDLRVPRDAIKAMMEIQFLGPLHVKTLARQASWQPDFFIYNEAENFKVPSKFRPDKMPPTLRKLARFWAELCRFVLIQLNYEGEYGVGWIFEENSGAAHLHLDDEDWLLLNPFVNGATGGRMLSLSNKADVDWLYAAAVHEATHLADGIKMHDEAFASAFTQNVAKTANRGKLIARIRKAVVARGARLGSTSSVVDDESIDRLPEPPSENPCGCEHNPAPEGSRYWPTEAVDADDLAPMTFLNALRTLMEYMNANPDEILADMNVGVDRPELTVVRLRRHRAPRLRHLLVMEVQKPDLLPEHLDVWQLVRASLATWMGNLAAVVPAGVPAPGELSVEQTRRRLATRQAELQLPLGQLCWGVFDTGRDLEIEIDDECFSGTRDEARVWDSDVEQLPEAQRELQRVRIERGEDMADDIDEQIQNRRLARQCVRDALDIDIDADDPEPLLDAIVDRLNFTIQFRRPARGETAWEVNVADTLEEARDEIWQESEDLGWIATIQNTAEVTEGMKYAVIQPDDPSSSGSGDLIYVITKWNQDPAKFRLFARSVAARLTGSFPGATSMRFQGRTYTVTPIGTSRPQNVEDEAVARVYIHNAMSMRASARMTAEQARDANEMISRVAMRMYAADGHPLWDAIVRDHERESTRQFERYVLECANDVGLMALDAQGQPYSLQRPPAFWTYRGEPHRITVPVDYVQPDELHEIEQAVADALELNMAIYPNEQREFIAAVWEEILRRRATGVIRSLPSRVDEAQAFGAHIREAARAIAREESRGFDFGADEDNVQWFWVWNGLQLPKRIAPPAPLPAARPRIVSGSQLVPGMSQTRTGGLVMNQTNGGRGEYPATLNTIVSGLRDTSYGNDTYDSVEFAIRDTVYRLWVAPFVRDQREDPYDPRYAVQVVEPPRPGGTVMEAFEEGQPTGDVIFETQDPQELVAWIRNFASDTALAEYQDPRSRGVRDTTGMSVAYLEDYITALDWMDDAEEIGGPDQRTYIEIMEGIAQIARRRATSPRTGYSISDIVTQKALTSETFEEVRKAINRMWDSALGRDEEDDEAFRRPLLRIASEATRRANVALDAEAKAAPDIADVRGQPEAVAALERAVAEKQNILLVGDAVIARQLADLTPTLFPPDGKAPISFHGSGLRGDLKRDVQKARNGVLYVFGFDDFHPDHLRELARELKSIPREERPLVIANAKSYPLPRRVIDIIDLPLRAQLTGEVTRAPKGESSAIIRARIAKGPPPPEDLTAARFAQLEIERGRDPGSPVKRSKRLQGDIPVGTRVHVIAAIIRPPELYVPRGNSGEVTVNNDNLGGYVEVTFDDGTKVVWAGDNFEHMSSDIEVEPESAQRYRMIEMNPKNTLLKENPGWVTRLLAKHFGSIQKKVPPQWVPQLDARPRYSKLVGDFNEYGCGAYGCVYPTLDRNVVLKVTTDDTEAQFAQDLSGMLPRQVTVTYHLVQKLPEEYKGRPVWLLWRDSADHVGEIIKVAGGKGKKAHVVEDAIADQHAAAQKAFLAVIKQIDPKGAKQLAKSMAASKKFKAKEIKAVMSGDYKKFVNEWADSLVAMGKKVPELQELAAGMVADLKTNGVLFGDVHDGNLGRVNGTWLIIDPGNVSVIQPEV